MRPHQVMFLGFLFFAGTVISLTFAGAWVSSTEVGILNSISGFVSTTILDRWTIQVPNINYVTTGIAALTKMDFAFFGGSLGLLRWLFICTIGAATVWGIFTIVIYSISGLWSRR